MHGSRSPRVMGSPHETAIEQKPKPSKSVLGRVDVATFKISNEELRTLDRLTTPWPPVVPEVGQTVLLAGFPGCEKSFSRPNSIDLEMYAAKWTVGSVSERDISIVRPPDSEVVDIHGRGFPQRQYDFGGMSGGPVVVAIDGYVFSWAFSGVIYELHQSMEILKAVRADFISEDGSVSEARYQGVVD